MTTYRFRSRQLAKPPRLEPISTSIVEVRIGELIGKGIMDAHIAEIVGCSAGTVRHYRRELEAARRRQGTGGAR